jgi:four helix bundle protein
LGSAIFLERDYGMRETDGERVVSVPRPAGKRASFSRMAPFRVLEAARAVEDEITRLLDNRTARLIHRAQLRDSAESVPANIREGMGRKPGPHRNQSYRDARGSAEETDEHLRANFAVGRIPIAAFRRMHNRLAWVVKILTDIIGD